MIKYIKAEKIINIVQEELSSYYETNQIDESILYSKLSRLMGKFRLETYPRDFCLVEVDHFKAKLPEDFYKACQILGCFKRKQCHYDRREETWTLRKEEVCEFSLCESICDACTDECGNIYRIIQKFHRYPETYEYTEFDVLCPTQDSIPYCSGDSINLHSNSKNQIRIDEEYIHTEFESGMIYINYLQKLEGEEFLIPDQPTVREWLIEELKTHALRILYQNGVPNLKQILDESKINLNSLQINAKNILRTFEWPEFYEVANIFMSRYGAWREKIDVPDHYTGHCYNDLPSVSYSYGEPNKY